MRPDPLLPSLVNLDMARAAGLSSDQVRQRVRSGEWQRLGRGWYLKRSSLVGLDTHAEQRRVHQLAAIAAARRLPGVTVCGPSAALLHGLPVLRVPDHVHLIAPPGGWTGRRAGLWLHEWRLPPEHRDLAPIGITTVERTWVDVGRIEGSMAAVVCGDPLLARDPDAHTRLREMIAELAGAHHLKRSLAALTVLDGRRESPLESCSGWYFAAHELPQPEWQINLFDDEGFVGRVDCDWEDARVVGEADGREKYQEKADVYREKRREDRIRATGRSVIRWGAADLRDGRLADRIRRLL